jgi:hypothetical protein
MNSTQFLAVQHWLAARHEWREALEADTPYSPETHPRLLLAVESLERAENRLESEMTRGDEKTEERNT